jgi:hypothetical protein
MRDLHVLSCYLRLRSAIRAILRNVSAVTPPRAATFIPARVALTNWPPRGDRRLCTNGGAGLVLIGQEGGAEAEIPMAFRFLFVRSNEAALAKAAHGLDEAAALVHH